MEWRDGSTFKWLMTRTEPMFVTDGTGGEGKGHSDSDFWIQFWGEY